VEEREVFIVLREQQSASRRSLVERSACAGLTLIQKPHMVSCHITASIPLDRAEELTYLVSVHLNSWRFLSQADFSNGVPGVVILIGKVLKACL
jgi:hypothetical protein